MSCLTSPDMTLKYEKRPYWSATVLNTNAQVEPLGVQLISISSPFSSSQISTGFSSGDGM